MGFQGSWFTGLAVVNQVRNSQYFLCAINQFSPEITSPGTTQAKGPLSKTQQYQAL